METKLKELRQILAQMDRPLIAFSGGVDSTVLLAFAHEVRGSQAVGVVAISPTFPAQELVEAQTLAREMGWQLIEIESQEMELPLFTANTDKRCYYCKDHRYRILKNFARKNGFTHILDGSNADDLQDYRPGQQASREQGIRSPLQEAGFTKADIRALAHQLNLPNWNKPSSACLASRIPYGTPLTLEALKQIEQAERALAGIGFQELRVRHHGTVARIEVLPDDFGLALKEKDAIIQALENTGYNYVTLDLGGFQSGNMNKGLTANG